MLKFIGWLFLLILMTQFQAMSATADDELTPEEKREVIALAGAFAKQWEESGNMDKIVKSLYASDFIERFIAEEKRRVAEENQRQPIANDLGKGRIFITGIEYRPALLEQASPAEWQRLYIAMSELLFYTGTHLANQTAGSLLRGKEPDDDKLVGTIERVIPVKMREELARHPILRTFLVKQTDAKPMATVEEMKEVISLLEKTKVEVRKAHGSSVHQPTQAARKMIDMLMPELLKRIGVEVRNESVWGLPPDTRLIAIPTKLLYYVVVAKINGQYKILWTEQISV